MSPFRTTDECPDLVLWTLIRDVFIAFAAACLLHALHRMSSGMLLGARITALTEVGEAYTPEERELLIHAIKRDSLKR